MSVSSLPPTAIINAIQVVRSEQHQYQLAITANGSGQVVCVQVDDAAAAEALLATTFAAMQVDKPGKLFT